MTTHEKLITAEELLYMPDNDMRQELIDGRIVEMPLYGALHGWVAARAGVLVGTFAKEHKLGKALLGGVGIILARDPDTVRAADICFYARGRFSNGLPTGYPDIAPDLVIEIDAPQDPPGYLAEKMPVWRRAGVPLVINLFPDTRSAEVITAAGATTLEQNDTLTCEPISPGFSVRVGALFP